MGNTDSSNSASAPSAPSAPTAPTAPTDRMSERNRYPELAKEVTATGAAAAAESAGPWASFGTYWGVKAGMGALEHGADKYARDYNQSRDQGNSHEYSMKMAELQNGWTSDGNSYVD